MLFLREQPVSGSVAPGDYHADLLITSNDLDEREVTIPASLVVVPTVYLPVVHKLSGPGE